MVAVLLIVEPTGVVLSIWKGMRMITVAPTFNTKLFPWNVYIPPLLVVVQPAGTIGAPTKVMPGIFRLSMTSISVHGILPLLCIWIIYSPWQPGVRLVFSALLTYLTKDIDPFGACIGGDCADTVPVRVPQLLPSSSS